MAEPEATKPWRWPGEWLRQESFWRDVASRTLATVFAAGIVYVFAVILGYVSQPRPWLLVGMVGLSLIMGIYIQWTARDEWIGPRWKLYLFMVWEVFAFGVIVLAATQGLLP